MRRLLWAFYLAGAAAWALGADEPPAKPPPADEPSLLEGDLLGDQSTPVVSPAIVEQPGAAARRTLIPEGTTILDRPAQPRRDPTGKWWTIPDGRAGQLRLLPCRLLEALEAAQAKDPQAGFRLSGVVYHYYDDYYLLLSHAVVVRPGAKAKAPTSAPAAKAPPPKPAPPAKPPAKPPATAPAGKWASPEDVARELLGETPATPIVPVAPPPTRTDETPSVAPAREPLQPGPGGMAAHRLTRLIPKGASDWFAIRFEADNTLREPPMRALPNRHLEKMEKWSAKGGAAGAVFYVTGEVHRYKGAEYLLLRHVIRKRSMDQF